MLANLSDEQLAHILATVEGNTPKVRHQPAERTPLSPEQQESFEAMGWRPCHKAIDTVTHPQTFLDGARTEQVMTSGCRAFYHVAIAALDSGPVHLADLARLQLASRYKGPRSIGAMIQAIANASQRSIRQTAATLRYA